RLLLAEGLNRSRPDLKRALWKIPVCRVRLTRRVYSLQRGRQSRSLLRSPWSCLSAGCIEGDRGTDERLERARVDLLPPMDVNRAPCVPVEARVEELGRVLQQSPLREGQLHYRLVRLAGADDPVVRPYG